MSLLKWLLIAVIAGAICDVLYGALVRWTLEATAFAGLPRLAEIAIQLASLPLAIVLVLLGVGERAARMLLLAAVVVVAGYLAGSVHLAALSFRILGGSARKPCRDAPKKNRRPPRRSGRALTVHEKARYLASWRRPRSTMSPRSSSSSISSS
jgi:hypothetical protein